MRTAFTLTAVAALATAGMARAEPIHIRAVIVLESKAACTQALGYVMESGPDAASAGNKVGDKLRAQYPKARNLANADNFKKDKHLGNHAVVLSQQTPKPGCRGKAMGVGFGKDEAEARTDAERLLGKVFPFATGKIKVELSKAF